MSGFTKAQRDMLDRIDSGVTSANSTRARVLDALRERGLIEFEETMVHADRYGRRWRRYFYNIRRAKYQMTRRACISCGCVYRGVLTCPDCGGAGEPLPQGGDAE